MTQQEALGYITEMLQKAVANKIYSNAEIFAINQSISKLQQDDIPNSDDTATKRAQAPKD